MANMLYGTNTLPAVPVINNRLQAIVLTDDLGTPYLVSPTLGIAGNSEGFNQCIYGCRPLTENYLHAAIGYSPNNATRYSSYIVVESYNGGTGVGASGNATYWDMGTAAIAMAPAGVASYMSTMGFTGAIDSKTGRYSGGGSFINNKYNGEAGDASYDKSQLYRSDAFYFSVYDNRSTGKQTTKCTAYASVNYFLQTTISDGGTYTNPWKLNTDAGSFAIGGISNNYTPPLGNMTTITTNSSLKWERYATNIFGQTSRKSGTTYYDLIRADMSLEIGSSYVYLNTPMLSFDTSGFKYNSSYPNAKMLIEMQYNFVVYGIASDPANAVYGSIANNDKVYMPGTGTKTYKVTAAANSEKALFTTNGMTFGIYYDSNAKYIYAKSSGSSSVTMTKCYIQQSVSTTTAASNPFVSKSGSTLTTSRTNLVAFGNTGAYRKIDVNFAIITNSGRLNFSIHWKYGSDSWEAIVVS